MRHLVLACLLICAPVVQAQDPQPCEGCLILTPEQVEQMKSDFVEMLNEAFRLGQADQKERCASLI
jgi:hypothetical protein